MNAESIVGVTGGGGFIGRHLVARLSGSGVTVRALSRRGGEPIAGVEWSTGDLADAEALARLVPREGIVVNLAFSRDPDPRSHVENARKLAAACVAGGVRHLIHCSTATVVGDSAAEIVDEKTPPSTRSGYESIKLAVEETLGERLQDHVQLTILRPTAVFGDGGANLVSLVDGRLHGTIAHSLKASLYGRRATNLVPVEDVVFAIETLVSGYTPPGPILIVSADEDPRNDVEGVDRLVLEELGTSVERRSRIRIPPIVLETLLRIKGGSYAPVRRRYLSRYPDWRTHTRTIDFGDAVRRFVRARVAKGCSH